MAINRYDLVKRHNPILKEFNRAAPLSVGNGEFAFTVDSTGLQTFPGYYQEGMPLCTQSQWGWHTAPLSDGKEDSSKELRLKRYDTYGREVGYAVSGEGQEELYNWLRQNPHRLNLCNIGFDMTDGYGRKSGIRDLSDIFQELDLWSGVITSNFNLNNAPVNVKTCCHPVYDAVGVRVESSLVGKGGLKVRFAFPYGSPSKSASDWNSDEKHIVEIVSCKGNYVDLLHVLDNDRYFIRIAFNEGAQVTRQGSNSFVLAAADGVPELEFTCLFSPYNLSEQHFLYQAVDTAAEQYWAGYWSRGGAVELAGSSDERALELERRIVLSQYLTAIQCTGSMPPQETGLTCNSWYGKFHLEMHYWHSAHFCLWGREKLLEKSLGWYQAVLDKAVELAKSQGYGGARWPKMVACDGLDSPSPIGPLLIWQQPHPILLAELCYRAHPDGRTLELYKEIVFETADFMASYAFFNSREDRYVLGPPLIPAQENHKPEITINPAFELEYWNWGLKLANLWRKRLGLNENPRWDMVASKLSRLPVLNGVYIAHENCPDTFGRFNYDHPSMLCAQGMLPGTMADRKIMGNTLDKVLKEWNFELTWGWDFPMIAMTATRLERPEAAIDILLMDAPKNTYLPNGHNRQGSRKDLPLYLPGNGGLLMAAATMAAGWDGYTGTAAPGFPKNGKWQVAWEGLLPNI